MPAPTIVVLCPHPEDTAPGQRLKYEQFFPSWRAAGYEVDVRPFWSMDTWRILYADGNIAGKVLGVVDGLRRRLGDVRAARRADVLYVFLHATPIGPPIVERLARRAGAPMVYDIDDLVYLPHGSSANRFMRWFRSQDRVVELMRLADHVIVCTRYLEEFARRHNEFVTDISSTIDTDAYVPRPHRERTEGVVVGWSGSHSTAPYLHLLDDVLRDLQRTDDIAIRVIGEPSFRIDGATVEALPWRSATEVTDLSAIDIGVYPLPDEEWVLGKSGLKALQYMALEIPPVATKIGTNLEIIEHGVNGFLVSDEDEWRNAIRRLVHEPELRRTMGKAARQTVEERYSVRANAPTYLQILERVTNLRDGGRARG